MPATGSVIDHHAAERQGEPDCPQPPARISVFPDAVGRTADADVQKDESEDAGAQRCHRLLTSRSTSPPVNS
jgi:hypothetical protein